ncbi:MAG TPA: chemotaxis protein CheW [Candidatus Eisenbacteria bacterium]|jgi:two-component system chemotaxis sensor kinase CheA
MTESDDRIIKEFLLESHENLDRLDQDLVVIEKDPASPDRLARIFRTLHTLKGTCGFLGFGKLEALAHGGETLLGRLRDGQLAMTAAIADTMLELVDAVREILAAIERSGSEGDAEYGALLSALRRAAGSPDPPAADVPALASAGAAPAAAVLAPAATPRLFDDLIEVGRLDPEQVRVAAREQARGDPRRLGEILVDKGVLQPYEVLEALVNRGGPLSVTRSAIRVDVALLERLVNQVGELVLVRNQILQSPAAPNHAPPSATSQRLDAITSELQETVMRARMQPLQSLWDALPRLVRDVALSCGKRVRLETQGGDTELDKTLLEAIRDPLVHLVRNAIDHGIEVPEARVLAGKAPEGVVRVRAFHHGGQVHIEVSDDGTGISVERVRQRALENGLVSPERAPRMRDADWLDLVFLPGFTTADRVTTLSGRGVGMDVVKTNLERIGGAIEIQSRPGLGTTFQLGIPLTLAVIPALCVGSGRDEYALPQASLLQLVRTGRSGSRPAVEWAQDTPVYRLRGRLVPLVFLREILQGKPPGRAGVGGALNIAILQADGPRFGLVVDEIRDTREIVVKPLSRLLRHAVLFAGATVGGDGRVSLILDVQGIARAAGLTGEKDPTAPEDGPPAPPSEPSAAPRPLVLMEIGAGRRAAMPLADVARLENLRPADVQRIGDCLAMQYRGEILPLVPVADVLGEERPAAAGSSAGVVVVLSHPLEAVGLVVERVIDIVVASVPSIETPGPRPVLGTVLLGGRLTEMLDVPALVGRARAQGLILSPIEVAR